MEISSVQWFSNKAYELFEQYSEGKFDRIELNKRMIEATNEAKEIEKQKLINMSVMSALHERKWIYEEMSGKKYKATKVEIRDLKETALEHYKETFKPE